MKSYKLKTIKQVAEVVNEKNLKGFIIDFEQWLKIVVKMKNSKLAKIVRIELETFKWNDDGNWGKIKQVNINIK